MQYFWQLVQIIQFYNSKITLSHKVFCLIHKDLLVVVRLVDSYTHLSLPFSLYLYHTMSSLVALGHIVWTCSIVTVDT